MTIHWSATTEGLDWDGLEALYRLAPLGHKSADFVPTVFGNSRYRWFARESGRLVADSRGHKKIVLYSVPGKEDFYRKLGFLPLLTAMAIFEDREGAVRRGHLGAT